MDVSDKLNITVGRRDDNSQVVKHSSVSAQHCVIRFEEGRWRIKDLRSTNGTHVNGKRITSSFVDNGDRVLVGMVEFVFNDGDLILQHAHETSNASSKERHRLLANAQRLALAAVSTFAVVIVGVAVTRSTEPSSVSKQDLFTAPTDLDGLIQNTRPSVLGVSCLDEYGTGWVLEAGGRKVAVTNFHVIKKCSTSGRVIIYSDQGEISSQVLGTDEFNDLAILEVSDSIEPLPTSATPPIGAWIMVIGNSIGLDRSVNYGTLTNNSEGWIITDAAINPGNSGGPVFNAEGRVIGVATAKLVDEDIDRVGLVVPLKHLCDSLLSCDVGQWE